MKHSIRTALLAVAALVLGTTLSAAPAGADGGHWDPRVPRPAKVVAKQLKCRDRMPTTAEGPANRGVFCHTVKDRVFGNRAFFVVRYDDLFDAKTYWRKKMLSPQPGTDAQCIVRRARVFVIPVLTQAELDASYQPYTTKLCIAVRDRLGGTLVWGAPF